jgi:hypothetical protein
MLANGLCGCVAAARVHLSLVAGTVRDSCCMVWLPPAAVAAAAVRGLNRARLRLLMSLPWWRPPRALSSVQRERRW